MHGHPALRLAAVTAAVWALALGVAIAQDAAPPAEPGGQPAPAAPPSAAAPIAPPAGTPPDPAAPDGAQAPVPDGPAPPENYRYQPAGRRDPFLNLLGTGGQPAGAGRRAPGAAGLTVAEVSVRGILESGGTMLAMIQAPDNKTYIVREGDRFVDGTVRSVTADGLVILQEVNDPLSLVKQREISKPLRAQANLKEQP